MADKDESDLFLDPVFEGERFRDHTMPVEVLADLARYRDLVIAVAKKIWKREHPMRFRLPQRWEDNFKLHIGTIAKGSARPQLVRKYGEGEGLLLPSQDPFLQARDLIAQAIAASQRSEPLPEIFAQHELSLFDGFGRGLRDGESIRLNVPGRPRGPVYRTDDRRRLSLTGSRTYTKEVEVAGVIDGTVRDVVVLKVPGQRRTVEVPCEEHVQVQASALWARKDNSRALVKGAATCNGSEEILKFVEVESITFLDPLLDLGHLEQRHSYLASLERGWFDGEGEAFPQEALSLLCKLLAGWHRLYDLPVPYLYPTPDGEVRAEWPAGRWTLAATIELPVLNAYLHATDLEGDGCEDVEDVDLQAPEGARQLIAFVLRFTQGEDL